MPMKAFSISSGFVPGGRSANFRPEPHPDSPHPMFGRLAGHHETGRERVIYDHHVKTVAGYRWIAWEDYPIRDGDGHLVEIQSVGHVITERKTLESRAHRRRATRPRTRAKPIAVPRHHEGHGNPHPRERRARHGAAPLGNPARARPGNLCRSHPPIGSLAARAHRRHPRFFENRIGGAGARKRRSRSASADRRHCRAPLHARPRQRHRDRHRDRRRPPYHPRGWHQAAPGSDEPEWATR